MLASVKRIAVEAGHRILEYYDTDMGISYKSDDSPLTRADKAAHDHICRSLTEAFPGIPVISEEGIVPDYETRSRYESFWLVDPLDGTKEFIKKNGEFTVNIALIERGRPVLGVVAIPVRERVYSARLGQGARLSVSGGEDKPIHSNSKFDLQNLSVSVSRSHPSGELDAFLRKIPGVQLRPLGSSLKFCYVAEGQVDFYPRFGPLNEWDTAAAHLVAQESGVRVISLQNEPLTYNKPIMKHAGFLAASSEELLHYLQSKLQD